MKAPLGGRAPQPAVQCTPVAKASQTPGRPLPFSGRLCGQSPGSFLKNSEDGTLDAWPGPLQPLLGAGLALPLQLSVQPALQWEPGAGRAGGGQREERKPKPPYRQARTPLAGRSPWRRRRGPAVKRTSLAGSVQAPAVV